jgi:hypothetical protein
MIQPPGQSAASVIGNRIALPRFPLKRRASFKLLVLLSGTDRGVLGKGRIRRGRVVHESRGRGPVARNIVFGTVLTLLVGAQAGVSFSQGASMPSSCGTGRLTLEGSTAFAPVAQQIGQAYTSICRGAAISVNAISTFNGLNALNSAGSAGSAASASGAKRQAATAQVAMSDGPAPGGYPALVGHPVGVIIFGVMVNKQADVFNLTVAELRGMFLGTITNWRQVNGANLPIRIVARRAVRRENPRIPHLSGYGGFVVDGGFMPGGNKVVKCDAFSSVKRESSARIGRAPSDGLPSGTG